MSGTSKKRCADCNELKDTTEYTTHRHGRLYPYCRPCANARAIEGRLRRRKADPIREWARLCTSSLRFRAQAGGYECSVTTEFLRSIAPTHCPVLGVELDYGTKGNGRPAPNSPSVDRVRPDGGYTPDNIIIVCNRVNMIKQDATPAELMAVAKFYAAIPPNLALEEHEHRPIRPRGGRATRHHQ